MQLNYKILSTKSGKSVIVRIDKNSYAFNVFEGFQRYCIEKEVSLSSISTFFLSNQYNIPPLVGAFLTLSDVGKESINVVWKENIVNHPVFGSIHKRDMQIFHYTSYSDNYLKVQCVEVNGQQNFLIEYEPLRGRFNPGLVPSEIPRNLFKKLAEKEKINFNDQIYDGANYCGEDVNIDSLALIFSSEGLNKVFEISDKASMIFCMDCRSLPEIVARYHSKMLDGTVKVYYINDNYCAEYCDLYQILKEFNSKNPSYLLPTQSKFQNKPIHHEKLEIIKTGDSFTFHRDSGFSLNKVEDEIALTSTFTPAYPNIIFLGTGCCIPSKYRNVSGILYETQNHSILLDCGEDTAGQIQRVYGELEPVLNKLKIIFISHSHSDHVLGVPRVLAHLYHPITILAPKKCRPFIESFYTNQIKHDFIEIDYVKSMEEIFYTDYPDLRTEILDKITPEFLSSDLSKYVSKLQIGDFDISLCSCIHSKNSVSISIKDKSENKSFSYSGDTIPSALFGYISNEVDLFIHEATFADDQYDQACAKLHSIESHALGLFKKTKAKNVLLTHFSNRNTIEELGSNSVVDFYRFVF